VNCANGDGGALDSGMIERVRSGEWPVWGKFPIFFVLARRLRNPRFASVAAPNSKVRSELPFAAGANNFAKPMTAPGSLRSSESISQMSSVSRSAVIGGVRLEIPDPNGSFF